MNIIQNKLNITFHTTSKPSTDLFSAEFSENYTRAGFLAKYIDIIENVEDNYEERFDGWWETMYTFKGGSNNENQ